VDTSVWSLALRKKGPADHPAVERLTQLLQNGEDVFLSGTILQEILQAFRSEPTFRRMVQHFEPFPLLPLDRSDHIAAARLHRLCAQKGVGASTIDCQIAVAAIRHGCALLSTDSDFERMALHCELVLA
jgi:predicted nucleic acid-binding protein